MQVTETLAEGLKREIKVVIPKQEMEAQLNVRLADATIRRRAVFTRPVSTSTSTIGM